MEAASRSLWEKKTLQSKSRGCMEPCQHAHQWQASYRLWRFLHENRVDTAAGYT
ncbi:hypothetical protein DPMN_175628 [Dreissena polymorpha]|uniref:Uncharacterized protein n=1 Tax=Dreissena polymorpha TaxID=45954 RepID=A0A9D4E5K1_DREPO|nr:hypothetical protein DPMN_175628 [Dreissena polymorpha]